MKPELIPGNRHSDARGAIRYNNDFNLSEIKRMYLIENNDCEFVRGWQGHKIEQRWFTAVSGKFLIQLKEVDNWEILNKDIPIESFELTSESLDVLHIPPGYVSSIRSLSEGAQLLAMSDYQLGEVNDEYRFEYKQ